MKEGEIMKKEFPEWVKTLYRGVRAGVAAGISAVIALKLVVNEDIFSKQTLFVVATAFGSAFLVAFGKWFRAWLDEKFGFDEKSLPAKLMPF